MEELIGLLACLAAAAHNPDSVPLNPGRMQPSVTEKDGAIFYSDFRVKNCPLSHPEHFVQPALSPDGKSVAAILVEAEGDPGYDTARSSLWLIDVATGKRRKLLASKPARGMTETLAAMWRPEFSLNGGFVYVEAEAWTTSSAIHQVNVKTGKQRYVIDGSVIMVIPRGRYAGYLAVQRHKYHKAPEYVAYDPIDIVRPDGKWTYEIPGSADFAENDSRFEQWLRKNGK